MDLITGQMYALSTFVYRCHLVMKVITITLIYKKSLSIWLEKWIRKKIAYIWEGHDLTGNSNFINLL